MTIATRIGRLTGLAVGLGIGAALAATPGIASADDLDFQINIDGMNLLPTADNGATATSGMGDIAIAFGSGANATAEGDMFDAAFADGTDSTATTGAAGVGEGEFNLASANGDGSQAIAGWGNFDTALTDGTDSKAAAIGSSIGVLGNNDLAYALGPNTIASSGSLVIFNVASSNDTAFVFDPFGTVGSSAFAGDGLNNLAAVFADGLTANAYGGDDMLSILPML